MTIAKSIPPDELDHWTNDPYLYQHLGLKTGDTFLWRVNLRTSWQTADGKIDRDRDYQLISWQPGYQAAHRVMLIDTESFLADIWPRDPRVHIFDSTLLPEQHRYHDQFTPYWFWFDWARDVERRQNLRDRLIGHETKLYQRPNMKFDCLLGKHKPWRTSICEQVESDQVLGQCVRRSYTGRGESWIDGTHIEDTDISQYQQPVFLTAGNAQADVLIPFHDRQTANLACFVTYKIYNDTWFTMLIETHDGRIFFTEKTAKALLGRRVFVMFGAAGSLAALRKIGFRTFSDVMDEGYDQIQDTETRHQSALALVRWLAQQDPVEIYRAAEEIIAHNQRLILETDWAKTMIDRIKDICQ